MKQERWEPDLTEPRDRALPVGLGSRPCLAVLMAALIGVVSGCGASDVSQASPCEPTTLPAAALDPPRPSADPVLFDEGFDALNTGAFTGAELNATWGTPPWENGVDQGRASVVASDEGQALRVSYPDGEIGSADSGVQWQYRFEPQQSVHLTYRVRFDDDFEFVRGGKLPGLAGGEANTGGQIPSGLDGWSSRVVWESEGCGSFYVYHPDMEDSWGEYVKWPLRFEPGRWHQIDQVVVINTPGENNGVLLGWLDGQLMAERRDLRFRDVDSFAVDVLYVSTFFGGGDKTYAPKSDQTVEFDSFVVRTVPASTIEH